MFHTRRSSHAFGDDPSVTIQRDVVGARGAKTDFDHVVGEFATGDEGPIHRVVGLGEVVDGRYVGAPNVDFYGAVVDDAFGEGEFGVVARAGRLGAQEAEKGSAEEFHVFFGDVVGFDGDGGGKDGFRRG